MQTILKSLLLSCMLMAVSSIGSAQNTFPPSGNVGIGTSIPGAPLHIYKSAEKDGIRLLILQRNGYLPWNIGFGESGSLQFDNIGVGMNIFPKGTIRVGSLRGTGTRMVVADSTGILGTQPIPQPSPAAGDNLGNHNATTTLNMNARDIINVFRLRFDGQPFIEQTSPSPWVYSNLLPGFKANYRFLIGQGNIDPTYQLKVEGDAYATGMWQSSDLRFKRNLSIIQNPLLKIQRLSGVTYESVFRAKHQRSVPTIRSSGLIAQELMDVLPEAVRQDVNGHYAVNYNSVMPLLVEAIKQQQAMIERQQKRLEQLERALSQKISPRKK